MTILANRPADLTDQQLDAALNAQADGAETEFALREWCADHGVSRVQVEHGWLGDLRVRVSGYNSGRRL